MLQLSARRAFRQELSETQTSVPQVPFLWRRTPEGLLQEGQKQGKSTNKDNKGKGRDWTSSIKGMSLDEAHTWFKDYETLTAKLAGKA